MAKLAGLFGGTFDPIHYGHLRPVNTLAAQLDIPQIELMPCHLPPHRATPAVTAAHRLTMAELAVQEFPRFRVNQFELNQTTPSYTYTTISALQQQQPDKHWCIFIGMDSLLGFCRWYRYRDILNHAHLLVCQRPGYVLQADDTLTELLATHQVSDARSLHQQAHGAIYIADSQLTDISATELRQQLAQGNWQHPMLPPAVAEYIRQQQLYTPT